MILDFSAKLGDNDVMVKVYGLECDKYWTIVRELDHEKKLVLYIHSTFVSKCSAIKFAKQYVEEYMNEL